MEYQIERLSADNITLLKPLFYSVFGKRVTAKFLKQKYNTQAFGAEYIGYMAFDVNGSVAAFYGVIPCHLSIASQTILAAQSADTMTHPDHRGKGLFMMLAEKTYDLARREGIKLVFGFPNQNSLPGFRKLGWQFMNDPLQVFTIIAGGIPYAPIANRIGLLRYLYNNIIQTFCKTSVDKTKFSNSNVDGVLRNDDFFTYKTYNQTFITDVAGVNILFRSDGVLKVGMLEGLDNGNVSVFIRGIQRLAKRIGCSQIVLMTSKNSSLYHSLVTKLSSRDAFPIGYIALDCSTPLFDTLQFDYCDIDIF